MRTKRKKILGLCIFILFCLIACTKLDIRQAIPKQDFFNAPALTDRTVLRVFQSIKEKNSKNEFITSFIQKKGLLVWNKFLKFDKVSKPAGSFHVNSSSVQNESNSNDTIIFIPFVLENENHVNGFIKAIVNDSIILSYSLAQDYKAYPVSSTNNTPTALEFASLIMLMDNKVFGYTKFEITDKSHLLSNASVYQTNRPIPYELSEVHEDDEPTTNLMNSASTCWLSPTIESINGTCTCGGPCWCTRVGCCATRTCVIILYGGGEGGVGFPSGEAPPSGPNSSGSGGGGQIPHSYPCTPSTTSLPFTSFSPNGNNLEENPPPTCPPPSGGIGWQPMPPVFTYSTIDSLLLNLSVPINHISDSIFALSLANNVEYGFIIVRKNGVIYAKNVKTSNEENYVDFNYTLAPGEVLIAESHTHQGTNIIDRPTHSGDDVTVLRKFKNKLQYTVFVDCGDKRYALVVEDVAKVNAFFANKLNDDIISQITDSCYAHPQKYINWQLATQSVITTFFSPSSTTGIGFYVSNNTAKTTYTKLN